MTCWVNNVVSVHSSNSCSEGVCSSSLPTYLYFQVFTHVYSYIMTLPIYTVWCEAKRYIAMVQFISFTYHPIKWLRFHENVVSLVERKLSYNDSVGVGFSCLRFEFIRRRFHGPMVLVLLNGVALFRYIWNLGGWMIELCYCNYYYNYYYFYCFDAVLVTVK